MEVILLIVLFMALAIFIAVVVMGYKWGLYLNRTSDRLTQLEMNIEQINEDVGLLHVGMERIIEHLERIEQPAKQEKAQDAFTPSAPRIIGIEIHAIKPKKEQEQSEQEEDKIKEPASTQAEEADRRRKKFANLRERMSIKEAAKALHISNSTAKRYEKWRLGID